MTEKTIFPSPLLDETLELLRSRGPDLTLRRIHEQTGLSLHWLQSLTKADGTADPGVRRIEALNTFLKQHVVLEAPAAVVSGSSP